MDQHNSVTLTSAEMGKLWTTYTGNTLARCVLKYYLQHADDQDIKMVLENVLNLSEAFVEKIKNIFIEENFPIPIGFINKDVNFDAPRLFSDEFYLHYLKYTGKAGMSIYSIAIPIMTRQDIRDFFVQALNSTVNLLTNVNDVLMKKRFYIKPPQIPIPEQVDFIKNKIISMVFLAMFGPFMQWRLHIYMILSRTLRDKGTDGSLVSPCI